MSNLSNIEKFQDLKKLSSLKAEYHRESIMDTVRMVVPSAETSDKIEGIFNGLKKAFLIFKFFKRT